MTNKELLSIYMPLVRFLADVMGTETEVVLYDLEADEVIEILNGGHSGRKKGSPPTPFLQKLKVEYDPEQNYIANYKGEFDNKEFVSSTYLIKNEGKLVGAVCINRDITAAKAVQRDLEKLLSGYNLISAEPKEEAVEKFDDTIIVIVKEKIQAAMDEIGVDSQRMTAKEKKKVVMILKRQGVTRMKGAVAEIANKLDISVPTVYRYMSEVSALFQ